MAKWVSSLLLLASISTPCFAESPRVPLTTQKSTQRLDALLESEFLCFSGVENKTYCSVGMAGGGFYGVSPRWALGLAIRQGLEMNTSFRAVYTGLQINAEYAIFGNTQTETESVVLDGKEVVARKSDAGATLRARISLDQFFFNTSTQVLPYSGFGAGLYYRFPIAQNLKLGFGAKADYLMRGSVTIHPVSFIASLSFWL